MVMTEQPDHEIVDLEFDPNVPPRPEEEIADAVAAESADVTSVAASPAPPAYISTER
jgi:hypothetical protein